MQLIRKINFQFAARSVSVLLSCAVVFHLLVIGGIIPFDIVWGGRLQNKEQMLVFESVSLIINMLVISIVAMRAGYIKSLFSFGVITALLWVLAALFTINTIGNLFALNSLESILFTPVTLISAILFSRLAIETKQNGVVQ